MTHTSLDLSNLDLEPWRSARLMVVGDLMLDEYLWGRVDRISPEAPVQVVRVGTETSVLGGAGNVIRNLISLGASVTAAGVVGDDAAGGLIRSRLEQLGVDSAGVMIDDNRPTSLKSRVMAGHQQVVRIDREDDAPVTEVHGRAILKLAARRLAELDGLILSDYAKGVLTRELVSGLISLFRDAGKPVVVDPKGRDYRRYHGAALITPNQKEALEALGLDYADPAAADTAATSLARDNGWSALLVTRGAQGMSLYRHSAEPYHIPARARQVYDVSGAGDTVVAVSGLGLACGWSLETSAQLANLAAGVVVAKVGTAAITEDELINAARPGRQGKIMSAAELEAAVDRLKADGKKVVFTNGCFDLLHVGHIHFLQRSRAEGDVLVVGLDDDQSVARLKGEARPVIGQTERARILAALDCVDLVTVFRTDDLPGLLDRLAPDVLTKGANYNIRGVVGGRRVESDGGRVALIPLEGEMTTSAVVKKVRQKNGD